MTSNKETLEKKLSSADISHRRLATGTPMWTEIPAVDLGRVKQFYEKIFGWTFPGFPTDEKAVAEAQGIMFEVPEERITKLRAGGGNFTRVEPDRMRLERDGKLAATTYVYMQVDDVDDALVEIERAGGKRFGGPKEHPPSDNSRIALFEDTEGNVHGLYSPAKEEAKEEA
ncbi:MAG: hypothetical protein M1815_001060 [Lichina confinis]|nr:MAG: hypothetical protein M1815_001060 [Lichina confinis]